MSEQFYSDARLYDRLFPGGEQDPVDHEIGDQAVERGCACWRPAPAGHGAERLLGTTKRPVDTQAATMSAALERELMRELAPALGCLRSRMDEDFDAWGLL